MRTAVLLALWDDDSTLLRQIDAERDLYVSRRCADISELLADVAVGLGQLAIIDEQLDGLDRTVIATLNSYGVPAIVLTRNDGVRWHDLGAWVAPWPGSPQRVVAEISRVLVAGTVSPQPTAAASLGDELFGLSPTAVDDGALGLPSARSAAFNPLDVPMAATTDGASSPLFDAVVQSQASASSPPPAPPEQLPPPPFDSAVGQVPLIAPTEAPAPSGQLDPALALPLPPAPSFEPPAPSADLPEASAELPAASSEQSPADITAAQPTTRMGRRRARHASHTASPVTPSQGNTSSYFSTASQEQSGEAKARVEPDDPPQQLNDSSVDAVKSAVSAGQTSIDSPPLPEGALAARVLPQPVQPVTRRSVRRSQTARPATPSDPVAAAQAAGAGIEVSPFAPPQQRGVASSDLAGSGFSASTGMSAASAAPYGSAASAAPYGSAASAAPYASAASAAIPTAASGAGGPWSAMSAAGTAWSATSAPFAASAAAPGGPMPAQTQVLAPGQINGYQNPAGSNGAQPPRRKGLRALLARKNGASTPSAGGPVIAGAPGAMPGTAPGGAAPGAGIPGAMPGTASGGVPGAGIPGAGVPGAMPGVGASGAGAPGLPGMPRSAMAAPAAAGVPGVVPGVMAPGMPGAGPVAGAVPGAVGIPGAVGVPGAGGPGMPGGQGTPGAAMPTAIPGSQGAPSAYAPNGQPRAVNGPASPGAALTPNGGLPTRRSTRAAFSAASAAGSGAAGAGPAGAGPARAGGAGVTGALAAASSQNNAAPLNAAATTHSAQPEVKLGWPVTAGTPHIAKKLTLPSLKSAKSLQFGAPTGRLGAPPWHWHWLPT